MAINIGGGWMEEFERIAVEKGWNIGKIAAFRGPLAGRLQEAINTVANHTAGFASVPKVKVDQVFGPRSEAALEEVRKMVMSPKFQQLYGGNKEYAETRSFLHSPNPENWMDGLAQLQGLFGVLGSPAKREMDQYESLVERQKRLQKEMPPEPKPGEWMERKEISPHWTSGVPDHIYGDKGASQQSQVKTAAGEYYNPNAPQQSVMPQQSPAEPAPWESMPQSRAPQQQQQSVLKRTPQQQQQQPRPKPVRSKAIGVAQQGLNSLGISPGKIDNTWGKNTAAAWNTFIKKYPDFAQKNGLKPAGRRRPPSASHLALLGDSRMLNWLKQQQQVRRPVSRPQQGGAMIASNENKLTKEAASREWYAGLEPAQQSKVRSYVGMLLQRGMDQEAALDKAQAVFGPQFAPAPAQPKQTFKPKLPSWMGSEMPAERPVEEVLPDQYKSLRERGHYASVVKTLVSLANDLDDLGAAEAAMAVDRHTALYKEATEKLYDITGETGEDLIGAAHPGGGPTIVPASDEGGKVETIVEEQKKNIERATKAPTGKYAALNKKANLENYAHLSSRAKAEGHKSPPKKYRETGAKSKSDYADPDNYKYPIHTEKNVRAALSYFSKPKNYNAYSPGERSSIWEKIKSAAKKYKIEVSPDNDPPWSKKSKGSLAVVIPKLVAKANALEEAGQVEAARVVDLTIHELMEGSPPPFVDRGAAIEAAGSEDTKASVIKLAKPPKQLDLPGVVPGRLDKLKNVGKGVGRVGKGVGKGVGKTLSKAKGLAGAGARGAGRLAGKGLVALRLAKIANGVLKLSNPYGWALLALELGSQAFSYFGSRSEDISTDIKDLLKYANELRSENKKIGPLVNNLVELLSPHIDYFADVEKLGNLKKQEDFQYLAKKLDQVASAMPRAGKLVDKIGELAEEWTINPMSWNLVDTHARIESKYNSLVKSLAEQGNYLNTLHGEALKKAKAKGKAPEETAEKGDFKKQYEKKYTGTLNSIIKLIKGNAEKAAQTFGSLANVKDFLAIVEKEKAKAPKYDADHLREANNRNWNYLYMPLKKRLASADVEIVKIAQDPPEKDLGYFIKLLNPNLGKGRKGKGKGRGGRRRDPAIRNLQEALISAGIPIAGRNPTDGIWGPNTRAAYNKFVQRANQIAPDLRLAPATSDRVPPKQIDLATRFAQQLQRYNIPSGPVKLTDEHTVRGTDLLNVRSFMRALGTDDPAYAKKVIQEAARGNLAPGSPYMMALDARRPGESDKIEMAVGKVYNALKNMAKRQQPTQQQRGDRYDPKTGLIIPDFNQPDARKQPAKPSGQIASLRAMNYGSAQSVSNAINYLYERLRNFSSSTSFEGTFGRGDPRQQVHELSQFVSDLKSALNKLASQVDYDNLNEKILDVHKALASLRRELG